MSKPSIARIRANVSDMGKVVKEMVAASELYGRAECMRVVLDKRTEGAKVELAKFKSQEQSDRLRRLEKKFDRLRGEIKTEVGI